MHYDSTLSDRAREIEHTTIPMRDGVELAARIWLPSGSEDEPVPAVIEYLPYRKSDNTAVRDSITHRTFAGHGYAGVRVDLRGSGESGGVLHDEYLEQELEDGEDVIAWVARQRWCSGRVALFGKSWGGFNGLQLAARRPEPLGCVVAVCASDDRYADDVHYMGGCLLGDNLSWASVMFSHNSCPPDPKHVGARWRDMWLERLEGSGLWLATWLEHQRRDAYWRHGSICEDYGAIECPVLAVSGWADGYSSAVFRLIERLQAPAIGLVGPWSHEFPHFGTPGPAIDFLGLCVRFFDRWLRGHENGLMDEPKARVWMQDACPPSTRYTQRPGRWVAEDRWPSPNVARHAFQLTSGYALAPTRESAFERDHTGNTKPLASPLSVGLFAGKWCSYNGPPDLPGDQREEDGGALVFETPLLERDLEILGAPELEVVLSSSQPVAQLAVRLSDVAPDRQATRVTYGLLNLCRRHGPDRCDPLVVGAKETVRVQLNDIAQRFPAGHRIRLSLSTSYFPLAWPSPRPVHLTVLPEASTLWLPVRRPRPEDATLEPLGEPVGHPPIPTSQLSPPELSWRVVRDLGAHSSTLEVVKDEGIVKLVDDGLVTSRCEREWYSFEDGDFASPRGRTEAWRRFERDDWSVSTHSWTCLTADEEHFHLEARLEATEGDEVIFSRDWDLCIARDGT